MLLRLLGVSMNRPLKVCFIGGYRPFPLRGLRGGGGTECGLCTVD